MQLSEHFSLEELSVTQVRDVDNTPPPAAVDNLKDVASTLEIVRAILGSKPMTITSGYRCKDVNDVVGGTENSAHLFGYAADFICSAFGTPLEICEVIAQSPSVHFDQLIAEGTWVHISVDPRMRGEVLTANFNGPRASYQRGLK